MHKVKHISILIACVLIAGLLLGFAVDRSNDSVCSEFSVVLLGDPDVHFVSQQGMVQFIHNHGHSVLGDEMNEIDTHTMEKDLLTIPYIETVEVYKTINHGVRVELTQRAPVMRIFFDNGSSMYVDDKGRYLQLSEDYSHKCLPITGLKAFASDVIPAEPITEGSALHHLWNLARFVGQDEFWSAQIMQVDIDPDRGAVLIPRVGNHEIIMGSPEDFLAKLDMLQAFYDRGIEQTNWNIYKSLDLRFEGQVVGIKR